MSRQTINPEDTFTSITEACLASADPQRAPAMEAYMKNKFAFYGIPAPERKLITKHIKTSFLIANTKEFWRLIDLLWNDSHRECQYIAIDLLLTVVKKLTLEDVERLERLVLEKSWWDTVDALASSLIGPIFMTHPKEFTQKSFAWSNSDNLWLIRTSIIGQLKFGKNTNWELLQQLILNHIETKEFFIRKAQGWALRQYAKVNAQSVIEFVRSNQDLSGLAKKEALKGLCK
jgi:3-methyladenine DNA glycosylase AlkD